MKLPSQGFSGLLGAMLQWFVVILLMNLWQALFEAGPSPLPLGRHHIIWGLRVQGRRQLSPCQQWGLVQSALHLWSLATSRQPATRFPNSLDIHHENCPAQSILVENLYLVTLCLRYIPALHCNANTECGGFRILCRFTACTLHLRHLRLYIRYSKTSF